MPSAPFDPCRQWLGLDAVDLVDPRRALGLSATENDPLAVERAAEMQLRRLRAVEPGPFETARTALMRRIEEARAAVLAQITSGAAGPRSAVGGLSMPPPPGGGGGAPPSAAPRPAVVPRVPPVPTVPRPQAPVAAPASWPTDGDETASSEATIVVRPRVVYRKRSGGGAVIGALIVALAAAAGGLYWYKFHAPRKTALVTPRTSSDKPSPAQEAREPSRPARREPEGQAGVPDRRISTDSPPDAPPPRRRKRRPADDDTVAQTPAQVPPIADPEPVQPASDTQPPPTMPAPPAVPDTPPEDSRQIDALLGGVRDALKAGDFEAAATAAKEAAGVATTQPSRERVERWTDLVTFAKGFADYREQALAAVKPGDEYDIDGKKVAVVEIDAKKFVYRHAGRNTTKPRDRIPGGIVMAIVTTWFDENPANDLYIGAYHASKEEPALEKARTAWEKAQAGGADASSLLPLLEDSLLNPPP